MAERARLSWSLEGEGPDLGGSVRWTRERRGQARPGPGRSVGRFKSSWLGCAPSARAAERAIGSNQAPGTAGQQSGPRCSPARQCGRARDVFVEFGCCRWRLESGVQSAGQLGQTGPLGGNLSLGRVVLGAGSVRVCDQAVRLANWLCCAVTGPGLGSRAGRDRTWCKGTAHGLLIDFRVGRQNGRQ